MNCLNFTIPGSRKYHFAKIDHSYIDLSHFISSITQNYTQTCEHIIFFNNFLIIVSPASANKNATKFSSLILIFDRESVAIINDNEK